jgi:hypothetical protein
MAMRGRHDLRASKYFIFIEIKLKTFPRFFNAQSLLLLAAKLIYFVITQRPWQQGTRRHYF